MSIRAHDNTIHEFLGLEILIKISFLILITNKENEDKSDFKILPVKDESVRIIESREADSPVSVSTHPPSSLSSTTFSDEVTQARQSKMN